MQIHHLEQGTPEWLAYRNEYFNASEAGAVMSVNPWFPKTPAELYDLKTGAQEVKVNKYMLNGVKNEPIALEALKKQEGLDLTPAVVSLGIFSASLDGADPDFNVLAEIKCPNSKESKLFTAKTIKQLFKVAPHYVYQMAQQMYVTQAQEMLFFVYHPDRKPHTLRLKHGDFVEYMDALIDAWHQFESMLYKGERPADDVVTEENPVVVALAQRYMAIKEEMDELKKGLDLLEKQLKELATHSGAKKYVVDKVQLIQTTRQGAVDYAKVPVLKGVDLEPYCTPSTTYFTLKVSK